MKRVNTLHLELKALRTQKGANVMQFVVSKTANVSAELQMFKQNLECLSKKCFSKKCFSKNQNVLKSKKCFSRITQEESFLLKHLNLSEECPPANINGFSIGHVLPSVTSTADTDSLFI